MAPDRIEKIEAIDAQAGRLLRLLVNFVDRTEAGKINHFTDEGLKGQKKAKRDAEELYRAIKAALEGEAIEQGGLPFE